MKNSSFYRLQCFPVLAKNRPRNGVFPVSNDIFLGFPAVGALKFSIDSLCRVIFCFDRMEGRNAQSVVCLPSGATRCRKPQAREQWRVGQKVRKMTIFGKKRAKSAPKKGLKVMILPFPALLRGFLRENPGANNNN
jgi:hypothetical protein